MDIQSYTYMHMLYICICICIYVYTYMYGPHASWILDPFQDLPSPEAGEASTAQPGANRWRGADTWHSAVLSMPGLGGVYRGFILLYEISNM